MSAVKKSYIPCGLSCSSRVSLTTRMMNLLTLMLVTLPGLTYSFSYSKYVCCNQPYTPPTPEISQKNMRSLILTLAKRDDREAPFRESWMEGRKRMSGVPSLPTLRTEGGSYTVSSGARRDPLLTGILSLLRSPSARRPASGFSSPQALASSAQDASRPLDFDASALVGKRGNGVITRIITGKRTFGELGGVNMDWE